MLPYLSAHFGNPSSVHWAGRRAKQGLEEAREQVAALINARPSQVLFTSGGTESNNLALRGALWAARRNRKGLHVITTAIEHSSVLAPLHALTREGCALTTLSVDSNGRVQVDDLTTAPRPETVLVSIGLANHEVGTIQPISALSRVTRERGVLLSRDALLRVLAPYRFRVNVLPEDDGGYTLWLRELNVAGSGRTLSQARQDLLAAVRSYVRDYSQHVDFYRHLPDRPAR